MMHRKLYLHLAILLVVSLAGCSNDNSQNRETTAKEILVENFKDSRGDINMDNNLHMDGQDIEIEYLDISGDNILTDSDSAFMQPILQNADSSSVTVEWFTEGAGRNSQIYLYEIITETESDNEINDSEKLQTIYKAQPDRIGSSRLLEADITKYRLVSILDADTMKLSRIRGGKDDAAKDDPSIDADIYKHYVLVDNLSENHGNLEDRLAYKVVTDAVESKLYTLAAAPAKDTGAKILLTSDHQIKPMVAANIQKAYETSGNFDAVFAGGDLVDVADRAYDWFYADNAFFRVFTGTAASDVNGRIYNGAAIAQETPIYNAIGNHDVMGVYDSTTPLVTQFNEPRTREQALMKWELYTGELQLEVVDGKENFITICSDDKKDGSNTDKSDISAYNENNIVGTSTAAANEQGTGGEVAPSVKSQKDSFIENNSYNTISSSEIFINPGSEDNEGKYYAVTIGDLRMIALDISRVWRLPNIGLGGKYSEIPGISELEYAGGDFIFEDISEDSRQVQFLDNELKSQEYQNAKYKMAMFHSEAHSMGGNQIPAFTDPVPKKAISPITGQEMTIYDYPIDKDYINTVIEPRLEKGGIQLLFEAHSHLWNRFKTAGGMNILESSNVGNSYGGFELEDKLREQLPTSFNAEDPYYPIRGEWNADNYTDSGDPYGLEPIAPNKHNLPDDKKYLDSNTVTSFSIIDTGRGCVDSYYYDTNDKDSEVVLFDSFEL